jgi:hypothetical protein
VRTKRGHQPNPEANEHPTAIHIIAFRAVLPSRNAMDESLEARSKHQRKINVGYIFKVYMDNWETVQQAAVGRNVLVCGAED